MSTPDAPESLEMPKKKKKKKKSFAILFAARLTIHLYLSSETSEAHSLANGPQVLKISEMRLKSSPQ
jgi:hypothetical protein